MQKNLSISKTLFSTIGKKIAQKIDISSKHQNYEKQLQSKLLVNKFSREVEFLHTKEN